MTRSVHLFLPFVVVNGRGGGGTSCLSGLYLAEVGADLNRRADRVFIWFIN